MSMTPEDFEGPRGRGPAAPGPIRASSMPWMAGMLDQIDYGLMVLDEMSTALYANRAARERLDGEACPLRLRCRQLQAALEADAARLRKALDDTVRRRLRCLLRLGQGPQGLVLALVPLAATDDPGRCDALAVIGRRQVCEALTAQLYASRHGLTFAESQVLQHLCTGAAPGEIARRQRVALSTVRTQISNIRWKTGTPTIGALVREVALLPPLVDALGASPG